MIGQVRNRRGWRTVPTGDEEAGAVLILALLFMVSAALLITALLAWSGTDISSVAAFQQNRALNYAANNAVETAIQNVRYETTACPAPGISIQVPGSAASSTMTMQVWCSPSSETEAASAASRVITFSACWIVSVQAGTCTQSAPYLQAVVTFDDYVAGDIATGNACTNHCGENETINSWVFEKSGL